MDWSAAPGRLSETSPAGYTASAWVCVGGTQNGSNITLALGESATCTITNDDQAATLIVIKDVINNNGGTAVAGDFTMSVTATNPSSASFAGAESPGTTITLDAGSYSVSESGPSGYAETDSADCSGTIANGETKTCTITNDDIPQGSQITPTATTCQSFSNGTSATLSQLNYSVKGGKINQVDPGVFFYWNKVTVAAAGTYTFTITQAITTSTTFNTFFNVAAGSNVFTSGCTAVNGATITQSGSVTTIVFTASAPGTYVIGVKYDSGSVKGETAPSPTTIHYTFTMGLPGSLSGLDLVKK